MGALEQNETPTHYAGDKVKQGKRVNALFTRKMVPDRIEKRFSARPRYSFIFSRAETFIQAGTRRDSGRENDFLPF